MKDFDDSKSVPPNSSLFIMNLIADYCGFGKENYFKMDAMNALIQERQIVYLNVRYRRTFYVEDAKKLADINPFIGNQDLDTLCRAHRVLLARYRIVHRKVRSLTVEIVCSHAEMLRF